MSNIATQACSICGQEFSGYGNNARPVNEGRCCNTCNTTTVIPARLTMVLSKAN